jgi:hypothetical protein
MADWTYRLKLTSPQQVRMKAAMEGVLDGTATRSPDQVIHEIGSPQQIASWEQLLSVDRAEYAQRNVSLESKRIADLLNLDSATQDQVRAVLYPVELKYAIAKGSDRSAADYFVADGIHLREREAALAKVVTPAQLASFLAHDERQAAAAALRRYTSR